MSTYTENHITEDDNGRLIRLDNVANLRDVGGYRTADGRRLRSGRLLRSASLHLLDEEGQEALINRGLRHVVDLRHDHELENAPNVFNGSATVNYQNVSLFAGLAPERVPIGAIPTLAEMYVEILDHSQDLIVRAVEPFSTGETTLVHCTAGKDRTGIIVALLLDLLGVDRETIVHDYALTDVYLEPLRDSFREFARENGLDMEHYEHMISCHPDYIRTFLDHLHERYGGAHAYLLQAGMTEGQLERIRQELTED
ncbi:MAG TPA: tyrosine-protein phosphatase [Deinococcales bacterium]|nr:tyrosine-protein phosphatase [Deinococcales bacterium]